ncbi:hypothetical protein JQU17_04310 [Ponticoccus sp. SC2-23]|uniref:hypothetical protein n=1 Tax=Alexandriicola marinus TaxID=2081710 RepID=UPI000FDB7CBC|nr:hypothetical protein [Alexandriicola marinus]MBM1219409.1 hypothetical protein [Ponticoccus sp. SC6-9]MBM1223519.1 hypothetical protein [Ponticoccus sp. SC6-15]MBM1229222.1 hypothetical protein [Ponticoccus sp. SC6-38]MBM1232485.1 hypothetical protein [Ponticoccus sp. SC6-45]MBM1237565.1 hypothetical protein [Ponticoccus sp. SC6-49]MBM1241496.1 hypothetical protein [Ponticoccus sp. SC2-64]MBM1246009.1 hypothetical protein [Ponticoccus sp. SC6-42]MBM1250487.1 hypothetical protein [Pontico
MKRALFALLPVPLAALAACVSSDQRVDTPDGPVLVVADDTLAWFTAVVVDGVEVSPFPEIGGLLVLDPEGAPLALGERSRAEIALERYCGAPVADLSYRGFGEDGLSTWSSAPCVDASVPAAPP